MKLVLLHAIQAAQARKDYREARILSLHAAGRHRFLSLAMRQGLLLPASEADSQEEAAILFDTLAESFERHLNNNNETKKSANNKTTPVLRSSR